MQVSLHTETRMANTPLEADGASRRRSAANR